MKATSASGSVKSVKLAMAGAAVFLLLWSGAAAAAAMAAAMTGALDSPGFWSGFGDGFLALLKLLVSPLYSVALVDTSADTRLYDAGYYLGVLLFAAFAGFAASPAEPEVAAVERRVDEARVNRPVQLS
jgi:hypothetical protein